MVLRIGGLWRVQARHATSGATPKGVLKAQQRAADAVKRADASKAVAKKAEAKAETLAKQYAACVRKAKRLKASVAKQDAMRKREHRKRKAKIESAHLARGRLEAAKAARALKKLQLEKRKTNIKRARVKADLVAKRSAADKKRAAMLKAEAVKAAKKAEEKRKVEAKRELKREKKRKLRESGPVAKFQLFVSQSTKNGKKTLTTAADEWKGMSEEERQPYADEATKNLQKRNEIRQSLKRPSGKYASYMKQHFPTVYMEVLKSSSNRREAFRLTVAAVAAKYKAEHMPRPQGGGDEQ